MLSGAVRWLKNYQERQTALLEQGDKFRKLEQLPDGPEKKEALRKLGNYRLTASATDTLVYSVLAECGVKNLPMERYLFRDRLELPVISQIQLAEILLDAHRMDDFNKVMPVISQFLQQDDSLQTAWLRLPNAGYWWRWYGSSAATQAAYLKLMSKSAPGQSRHGAPGKMAARQPRQRFLLGLHQGYGGLPGSPVCLPPPDQGRHGGHGGGNPL